MKRDDKSDLNCNLLGRNVPCKDHELLRMLSSWWQA